MRKDNTFLVIYYLTFTINDKANFVTILKNKIWFQFKGTRKEWY